MALKDVLGSLTLEQALELVGKHVEECEQNNKPIPERVSRLGRYLWNQHRLQSGTGVFGTLDLNEEEIRYD